MMQLQSMTGYGRGSTENFKVEIRSSNHKNLDIQANIPPYLYPYEMQIKKMVKQKFARGRIDLYIPRQEIGNMKIKINKNLAREYYDALLEVKDELDIHDDIKIDILALQRDIFLTDDPEIDDSELYEAVNLALEDLSKSRIDEGQDLIKDISQRRLLMSRYLENIEEKRVEFINNAREKLYDKIKEILGNTVIDDARIVQETAILVERTDITEEVIRIKSHLDKFNDVLQAGNTVGKKLDFVIQELRREVNTISAKAQDIYINNNVVEMKHELEKIKEQIQNLQ